MNKALLEFLITAIVLIVIIFTIALLVQALFPGFVSMTTVR